METAVKKKGFSLDTEQHILRHFTDILKGLAICHSYDVIHSDLKPDNIVWFGDVDGKEGNFKLIDFGAAQEFSSQKKELRHVVAAHAYRAPEVFLARGQYNHKIDIWSAGCVLYFMCTKKMLFYEFGDIHGDLTDIFQVLRAPTEETWPGVTSLLKWKESYTTISKNMTGKYFNRISSYTLIRNVIDQCLILNPSNRPSSKKLLSYIREL